MTLFRLTALDDRTWDKSGIWKTADALQILNSVIRNMEQVAILAELDTSDGLEGDIFSQIFHKSFTNRTDTLVS